MKKLKVRILLRVSSNQQLEADGDLGVQRKLTLDYVAKHPEWELDEKEYFEGSNSGYSNSVAERDVLQEAYADALKGEYDILAIYKDDRLGRRMWEIGGYIMELKKAGVDVYTSKDGLISPETDDVMGQIVLALRYGNAQKSSSDTGMRVKDTAQKLVEQGKFMGGKAPYGYELQYSGEISKHGRALKHLVILNEQADTVKTIYDLSLNKEYGSAKIARVLNEDERYRKLAPHTEWKSGTITSILTNPIYAGHTAYKRRERINGKYHRLDSKDWVISEYPNEDIVIIDPDTWNKVQEARKRRGDKYIKKLEHKDVTVISRNDGMLPLIDVLHCGYCGCKMVNGSKYNYWTIKGTGEKRASKIPIYKCQTAWQGVPHDKTKQFRADKIEPVIFEALAQYVEKLQENEDIFSQIQANQNVEKKEKEKELKDLKKNLHEIQKKIHIMEGKIPDAITGEYTISLEVLVDAIDNKKREEAEQLEAIRRKEDEITGLAVSAQEWNELLDKIPTWKDIFLNADTASKRVLVDKIVERIDLWRDEVKIRFKFDLDSFLDQSRMSIDIGVQEPRI